MPLLKGTAGKAMPDMAMGYITRKNKARYIDVQNLFIDETIPCSSKKRRRGSGNIRTTTKESIIISNSLPTEPTTPIRSWCKSMQRLVRKRCSRVASAS